MVPRNSSAWIGLTDIYHEGFDKWLSRKSYTYSNCSPAQPDNHNGNHDYVEFLGWNDKWNGLPNDKRSITGYVVEYDDISDPDPVKNPVSGHDYEYIYYPGITWPAAKPEAEATTYNGIDGPLDTITNHMSNAVVTELKTIDSRPWQGVYGERKEG